MRLGCGSVTVTVTLTVRAGVRLPLTWLSAGLRQKLRVREANGALLGVSECLCGYCRDQTC